MRRFVITAGLVVGLCSTAYANEWFSVNYNTHKCGEIFQVTGVFHSPQEIIDVYHKNGVVADIKRNADDTIESVNVKNTSVIFYANIKSCQEAEQLKRSR